MRRVFCFVLSIGLIAGLVSHVSAVEYSKDMVATVQRILNRWGYQCGPADGIAGENTKQAVMDFQMDQGVDITGEIDENLMDRMMCGIPWTVFDKRCHYATEVWNANSDRTRVSHVNSVLLNDTDEQYCPNNNLCISFNPGSSEKKMITAVHVSSVGDDVDYSMAIVELESFLYGLDLNIGNPLDAYDIVLEIFKDNKETCLVDGISFTNDSSNGGIDLTGEYLDSGNASGLENGEAESAAWTEEDTLTEGYLAVSSQADLQDIADYLGASPDVVGAHMDLDLEKPAQEDGKRSRKRYRIKGELLAFPGIYVLTFDQEEMVSLAFRFQDSGTYDPDEVIGMMNEFLGKHYNQNMMSSKVSSVCGWDLGDYTVKLSYYYKNQSDMYYGPQSVEFSEYSL